MNDLQKIIDVIEKNAAAFFTTMSEDSAKNLTEAFNVYFEAIGDSPTIDRRVAEAYAWIECIYHRDDDCPLYADRLYDYLSTELAKYGKVHEYVPACATGKIYPSDLEITL